jgi:hypothetical protein
MIEQQELTPLVGGEDNSEIKRFRVDVYMPKDIEKNEWDFIHGDNPKQNQLATK